MEQSSYVENPPSTEKSIGAHPYSTRCRHLSAVCADDIVGRSVGQKRENRSLGWSKLIVRRRRSFLYSTTAAQRDLMRAKPHLGVVALSILSSRDTSPDFERSRRLIENARWLNQVLDDHDLPATWFISDAEVQAVRARVASSQAAHEIGFLVDVGRSSARAKFGRELDRQLVTARACGVEVSSVAAFGGVLPQPDMMVKRGVSAICYIDHHQVRWRRAIQWHKVEAPRFGLWNLPSTLEIGAGGWWSQAKARNQALRQAADVANGAGFSHLTIELEHVSGRSARRTLKAVVGDVSALCEKGRLETRTLSGVVDLLTARATIRPAHSILRAA